MSTRQLSITTLIISFVLHYINAYDEYKLIISHLDGSLDNYDAIYASVCTESNQQNEIYKTNTIDGKTQLEWNQIFNFENDGQNKLIIKLYNIDSDDNIQYLGQTKPLSTIQMIDCDDIYAERMKLYDEYNEIISSDLALFIEVEKEDCDRNSGRKDKGKKDSVKIAL